jgi:hypothetical protein
MTSLNAWTAAERTAFDALLAATGATEGRQAFLGHLPKALNVWMFTTGGGNTNTDALWIPGGSAWMEARIEGQFTDRATAQALAMAIIIKGQLLAQGDLTFRVSSCPVIDEEDRILRNQENPTALWIIRLPFNFIFTTQPLT